LQLMEGYQLSMGSIRSKEGSSMLFFSMGLIYGRYEFGK